MNFPAVSVLCDSGSVRPFLTEDGTVCFPPTMFAVIDGMSGLYLPSTGPVLYGKRTGGQMVCQEIAQSLMASLNVGFGLEVALMRANNVVRNTIQKRCGCYPPAELRPGATLVALKNSDTGMQLIQAGDCLAVWEGVNGKIGGTENLAYESEVHLQEVIAELMKKHNGDRQKMWEEFAPIVTGSRRAVHNRRYAIVNGDPELCSHWQRCEFPAESLRRLILFTDGLVPLEWTSDSFKLAEHVFSFYEKGGLNAVLVATHIIADQTTGASHVSRQEATAIALEFAQ